jgi:hypothetical protein
VSDIWDDGQGPFNLNPSGYAAWQSGVDQDIATGQTGNASVDNWSFDRGFDNNAFSNLGSGGAKSSGLSSGAGNQGGEGGGNYTGLGSGFKVPNMSDVLTGMMNGPGGASGSQSGWIAGLEKWMEGWFIRFALIVLGFIFIAAGLAMFRTPFTDGLRRGAAQGIRDVTAR